MRFQARTLVIVTALAAFGSLQLRADEPLPKDPNNVYGKLDNGMSYIIRVHKNPPERVALYLHVRTGALNETEAQNGLAHFLEHMAFNGTKHFEPDTLIPYMNKLGMEFGADSNAHTNHRETVYKLLMPDTKQETIDKAMTILSDFAGEMQLPAVEIDKERPVILEESRSHKSAGERLQKEWMKKVLSGTRIAVHDVIGDESQIKTFPRKEFEDYWNTWYRPENMTLIVVGEIDPDKIVAEAKKYFGGQKGRAKVRKPTGTGIKPIEKTRAFVLTDPEQVVGEVEMLAIKAGRPPIRTFKQYRDDQISDIAAWMVSRRMREMVEKGTASFRQASVGVTELEHEATIPLGQASGEPGDWNKMLEQVIVEVSRAMDHGFTPRELKLARESLLSRAERAVKTEATRNARQVVGQLANDVGADQPILSAAQELELTKRVLKDVTVEEIHKSFVDDFKTRNYTYVLQMPSKKEGFKLPTTDEVLAAAKEAWARKTSATKEEKSVDSILASAPTPGKVVGEKADADLKVTTFTLSNGVVCHHRFMDYKKDDVHVTITIPGGTIEETKANHGISEVASLVLQDHATSRMDSTQVRDLMTGKNVRVGGRIGLDAMNVNVSGSPKDLETGLQLAYALLTDGRIEASAFDNWKKQTLQFIEMSSKRPEGKLRDAMQETFFANDTRLCSLTPNEVNNQTIKDGQAWFKRIVERGAMEVAIVGDMKLDEAKQLAAKYLGALPKRTGTFRDMDRYRKLVRGDGPYAKDVKFDSITEKGFALAGFVGCDESNVKDRRQLTMAARILSDRMIKRIREDEQLVYGIGCQSQPSNGLPGTGMILAAAPTDPSKAGKLADTILEMMKQFSDKGPTAEEIGIAKKQISKQLETQMKEPGFWVQSLSHLEYHQRSLAELKDLPGVYDTYTAADLQGVAKKYIKDDKAIRLTVVPQGGSTAEKSDSPKKNKKGRRARPARSGAGKDSAE